MKLLNALEDSNRISTLIMSLTNRHTHFALLCKIPATGLVPKKFDSLRFRSDELDSFFFAAATKLDGLGKKPITGMNQLYASCFRYFQDLLHVKIRADGVVRSRGGEEVGLVWGDFEVLNTFDELEQKGTLSLSSRVVSHQNEQCEMRIKN
jgi:hypothetical protein